MAIAATEIEQAGERPSPRLVLARLDRIDTWSLPWLFIGVIGLGFLSSAR